MTKKSKRWVDDYDDDYFSDKRRSKKNKERRQKKRMKNALRQNNLDELMRMDEEQPYE